MATNRSIATQRMLAAAMVAVGLIVCSNYLMDSSVTAVFGRARETKLKAPPKKVKYSEFPHSVKAHQKECSSCHKFPSDNWKKVRSGKDAFADITDYPKHDTCLSCHKRQFFSGAKPVICSICHTNPSPRNSSRHPFPNPRELFDLSPKGKKAESDFVISFPHDKHIEIVSRLGKRPVEFANAAFIVGTRKLAGEESCSVCHQTMKPQGDSKDEYITPAPATLGDGFWLKKGTFKTIPLGHTTCFTCHSADGGMVPEPKTCSACHQLKPAPAPADFDEKTAEAMKIDDKQMMDSWRRRDSSGKFQHAFMAHVDMECATCHTVSKLNWADPLTKKVSISSCATCHVTATSDEGGALNFELDKRKADATFQCVKCHVTFGRSAVPKSHTDAISAGK